MVYAIPLFIFCLISMPPMVCELVCSKHIVSCFVIVFISFHMICNHTKCILLCDCNNMEFAAKYLSRGYLHFKLGSHIRRYQIDALVQDCSNSIANALELRQFCTRPSKYAPWFTQYRYVVKILSINLPFDTQLHCDLINDLYMVCLGHIGSENLKWHKTHVMLT